MNKLFWVLVGLFFLFSALRLAYDSGRLNQTLSYCNPFLDNCSETSYSINRSLPDVIDNDCIEAKIHSLSANFSGTLHYKNCRITKKEIVCFDKKGKEKCKIEFS